MFLNHLVLVNATGTNANGDGCWYCHEEGHYRLECPKHITALSNSDNVKTTVLIHLGDSDNDVLSPQDDLDKISLDEEGLKMDALCFHTSVCFDKNEDPDDVEDLLNVDFEGNIVPLRTNGLEVFPTDDKDKCVFGHHNEYNINDLPSLNAVLNKVRVHQNKPLLWVSQMKQKFLTIGINTTLDLTSVMDSGTLNEKLKGHGLKTLHSTTGLGLEGTVHGATVFGDSRAPRPPNVDAHLQQEVEIARVFNIVGERLGKANILGWINAILHKLRCVRMTNTTKQFLSVVNKTLNETLRAYGFAPFFKETLLALMIPLRCLAQNRAKRAHRGLNPDFRPGQA